MYWKDPQYVWCPVHKHYCECYEYEETKFRCPLGGEFRLRLYYDARDYLKEMTEKEKKEFHRERAREGMKKLRIRRRQVSAI